MGNWSGGAYSAAGSTAFDHCAAAANYTNGVTLVFAISNTFQWSMALYESTWNLVVGTSYPIDFTVDSSRLDSATATAVNPNEVLVPLAPALFKQFMRGEKLKVETASQTFPFDLTNTSEMLPALLKCAESYAGTAPASSNPFATP